MIGFAFFYDLLSSRPDYQSLHKTLFQALAVSFVEVLNVSMTELIHNQAAYKSFKRYF